MGESKKKGAEVIGLKGQKQFIDEGEFRRILDSAAHNFAMLVVTSWLVRGHDYSDDTKCQEVIAGLARALIALADTDATLFINVMSQAPGGIQYKYSYNGPLAMMRTVEVIRALSGAGSKLAAIASNLCRDDLAAYLATVAPGSNFLSSILLQAEQGGDDGKDSN